MSCESGNVFAASYVPHLDRLVLTPRCQSLAIRAECYGSDGGDVLAAAVPVKVCDQLTGMSLEGVNTLVGCHVPQLNRTIIGRCQCLAVRTVRYGKHIGPGFRIEGRDGPVIRNTAYLDHAPAVSVSQGLSIGTPCHGTDPFLFFFDGGDGLAGPDIPQLDCQAIYGSRDLPSGLQATHVTQSACPLKVAVFSAGRHAPESDCLVVTSRCQSLSVWAERHRSDPRELPINAAL